MAIFSRTRPTTPITGSRFPVTSSGSAGKAAAAYNPNSAHTHSMLSQASRVPRLANITSVSAQLKAHAGRTGTTKSGRK